MGRKKIAVLVAQTEDKMQHAFLSGFLKQAYIQNYDVCVFSMLLKFQETQPRGVGDSNIYNLINYSSFDAIVILKDTIQTAGVALKLEKRIKDVFKGPVVVVDKESKNFPTIMMDNYTPYYDLVSHLIEHHGYRDITFVNGIKNHPHSMQREKAYRDALRDHGITVPEDDIFYGKYIYRSGTEAAEFLMKRRGNHMPEAIACANDEMAMGVAAKLTAHGYRIPEDVALIGFDMTDEGRACPKSITSAEKPSAPCGEYTARWVKAQLDGTHIGEFKSSSPEFFGSSCGCDDTKVITESIKRNNWTTDVSVNSYKSNYNHFMDDLLSTSDMNDFFGTIFQYVYQIRDFESLSICMNDGWNDPVKVNSDAYVTTGYTTKMHRVIRCGSDPDSGNVIDFDDEFDSKLMIPDMWAPHEKPQTYFFTPIHFNEKSYGYVVISYGDEHKALNEDFRNWVTNVSQGMMAFYRQASYASLLKKLEATQVRDQLTGLYNYKGFIEKATARFQLNGEKRKVVIVAVDIFRIKEINSNFGRRTGDQVICSLSRIIQDITLDSEICSRMCNDEFLFAAPSEDLVGMRGKIFCSNLDERLKDLNRQNDSYNINIMTGLSVREVADQDELEEAVNEAIGIKNKKKDTAMAVISKQGGGDADRDRLVNQILDENRIIYYFQPIVNARTGIIYAYEALMRFDINEKLSPMDFLESAEKLGRLADVEYATFNNVISHLKKYTYLFNGKKIFINSIPGCGLDQRRRSILARLLKGVNEQVVVEFTEETQMKDSELQQLKDSYSQIRVETAIDDYGTGYSNVDNLMRYMPKYVKIDRVLMKDIHKSVQKQHFVRNIIEYAHDNDILALAEGVENTNELREVIRLGVDLIQGFYTGRPEARIVEGIASTIKNEIVQYNQTTLNRYGSKIYITNGESKLSLVTLATDKYTQIRVAGYNQGDILEIIGADGFKSNISIDVEDGQTCGIKLNNVNLAGEREKPCINIGENCNVTLVLAQDNLLRTGGIRVPESSVLTVRGNGDIDIDVNNGKYFGIGNAINEKHGDLIFEQDGRVTISASGLRGVGIGSGRGGNIFINRGSYELELRGQYGVGIGSLSGDRSISIMKCNLSCIFMNTTGVAIGTMSGNTDITIANTALKLECGGTECVGVGTMNGSRCNVAVATSSVCVESLTSNFYGIGGGTDTNITIDHADYRVTLQGSDAFAMGNASRNAVICCNESAVHTDVRNSAGSDMATEDRHITLKNGTYEFVNNGISLYRDIEYTMMS